MSIKDRIIRMGQGYLHEEKLYGKQFIDTYEFLQTSQWWTKEQHEEYQIQKIKKVLTEAYSNVPYYTKLFNEYDINVSKIQDFSDIKKIPYLTKEIIMDNIDLLYNKNFPKYRIEYKTTGGSTGIPMGLYQDRFETRMREKAFVTHMWNRVGYDIRVKQKIVYLRGINIKGKFEYNGKNLILNSFLLNENNFLEYLNMIEQFNPDFINGYPSVIYLLAKYMIDNNIRRRIKNTKAILLTSENVFDFQRKIIEEAFGVRVYSFYGHTERACIAGECEESAYYHIHSEYGYTELINSSGNESTKENELSEIVCTGFINPVMPFIRYKTKDIAINTLKKCNCGRNYKLIKKIEGRTQDFILDEFNNIITFTCNDEPLWGIKDKINSYQYIQAEKGKILLNINPKNHINTDEINRVKYEFESIFKNINLQIKIVDNIDREKNGKFKYLIQNLNISSISSISDSKN